ncbi:MAG: CCA tRNA nucleotidyltransferase [Clostridia bacterium]|nr:CCA tRNA nucleotidyltransferase [Clostridia bacterium]
MKFNLPQKIEYVIDTLIANGNNAYIVGGCVRDLLCGKTPHDYDITTSATPEETQSLFDKTVATGIKHGTITVIIDGTPIEVTTFRTEGGYNDSRHPESVNFVRDVADDLSRRDFTVNAMCYNHIEGLIDLYGGQEDIKAQILKAVGNPKTRFTEDALRILRLFRFAATLKFNIEKETFNAAIKCAPLLSNISAERIFTELQKAALGNNVECLSPLLYTNCLEDYFISDGNLTKIKNLPNQDNLRTFALLYSTSCNLQKTLDNLKCSNAIKNYCITMSGLVSHPVNNDKVAVKKALYHADIDILKDALQYYQDILNVNIDEHIALLDDIIKNNEPYKISDLDISGEDIISLGFNGKQVGEKLEFLLNAVINDPTLNKREKLLNLICN